MKKLRRHCLLLAICMFTVYFGLAAWLSDLNFDNALYRLWYLNGFLNTSEAVEIACYDDNHLNNLPMLPNNITSDSSIFFVETSCHGNQGIHLSPRQACAVESAAKMNPHTQVYVMFPSPVIENGSVSPQVQQLRTYSNIHLRHVSMAQYFRDTPLQEWYEVGMLRTSHWPRSHTSDALRYLTLWKFGGIYLDLDVIVTKTLEDLVNFAGAESDEDVAAGVLSFSRHGLGHEMAEECVNDLRRNFRGYDWGYNGPGVITRILKQYCGTDNVSKMTPEKCNSFTVFPPHTFYPIPWRKWRLYFNTTNSAETLRMLNHSRAIHVWNQFSTQANITVGSNQPYGVFASKFCPRVYTHIGTVF